MTAGYVRPTFTEPTYRDEHGEPFTYGDRWGMAGPPEDTYSRDSHPERFAPLHDVADALVAHLVATYDVEAVRDDAALADVRRDVLPLLRAVRLVPAAADAAPLTVGWTDYPGVVVRAGALFEGWLPHCGCDACDETAATVAGQVEDLVLGVARGRLQETASAGAVGHRLDTDDGWSSSTGDGSHVAAARLREAERRLAALPDGWQPWPLRAGRRTG